jgi:hypothetical protein
VWLDAGRKKVSRSSNVQLIRPHYAGFIRGRLLVGKSKLQLDYQSTIIQSGAGFEVANWSGPSSHTALDLLGGARYWNQNVDR